MTYGISGYGEMIFDSRRINAYAEALRRALKPGAAVLDIGTGTGIFALLACKFGAGRVFAIEPNNAVQTAKEIAKANNYDHKIRFFQNLSTSVSLPQQVHMIISDLRGTLPLYGLHIPTVIDAKNRFLRPQGIMIPQKDRLWAAIVSSSELYDRLIRPWEENPFDLNMNAAKQLALNSWYRRSVSPDDLLTEPVCWASIDYFTVRQPHVRGQASWIIKKAGTAHGLCLWFDSDLYGEIGFSNAPTEPSMIYGQALFPWPEPKILKPGDRVFISLKADLTGEHYVWRWDTTITPNNSKDQPKDRFRQSTFFGLPLSLSRLKKGRFA